jgi:gamma-glutamylcyclotransferase (GGCT)/AIG2-like uncharacterized protein YtfP
MPVNADCRYLFVYGTLRPGCGHSMSSFLSERARCMGNARINGRLYQCGWFPGLLPAEEPEDWVRGDLFDLTSAEATLAELDRYENDASDLFERRQVPVFSDSGEKCNAWVYFYRGQVDPARRIRSGDFLLPA